MRICECEQYLRLETRRRTRISLALAALPQELLHHPRLFSTSTWYSNETKTYIILPYLESSFSEEDAVNIVYLLFHLVLFLKFDVRLFPQQHTEKVYHFYGLKRTQRTVVKPREELQEPNKNTQPHYFQKKFLAGRYLLIVHNTSWKRFRPAYGSSILANLFKPACPRLRASLILIYLSAL